MPTISEAIVAPSSQTIQPARFERITPADGLSYPIVRNILQDHQGFMWFATDGGLNKYDGYEFTVYANDPGDPTSIRFDAVRVVYEDSDGTLWVGGGGGLDRFDRTTEAFTHVDTRGQVFAIHEDRSGILWVGFWHGLYGYDRATGSMVEEYHINPETPPSPDALVNDAVVALEQDRSGKLWIGTPDGLACLDSQTGTLTRFPQDPSEPETPGQESVATLYGDDQGKLWMGTAGGLGQFDPATGTAVRYSHDADDPQSLIDNEVIAILQDSAGALWVGTPSGLDRVDAGDAAAEPGPRNTHARFLHYQHDPGDPGSLSDDVITALFEDRSGVLWIGTANGISKFNRRASEFTHYRKSIGAPAGETPGPALSDSKVSAIYEDRDGVLWIGTFNGGLDRLNRQTGEVANYRNDPTDPDSLSHNTVTAVYRDSRGILWVGTANGWLEQFDLQSGSFIHVRRVDAGVLNLVEDQSGDLWIGTEGDGLYRFDVETGTLTHHIQYWTDPDHWWRVGTLSSHIISSLYVDQQGVPWVGTRYGGINLWDEAQKRFNHLRHDPDDPDSLGDEQVLAIFEDADLFPGVVWIGTGGGGLNRFDRASSTFTRFTEKDGLSSDTVTCIRADNAGMLWLGTVKGLSRFDPRTQTFRNYDERDGVGVFGNGAAPGVCVKSQSGELFFGGLGGLLSFHPERIEDNRQAPTTVITSLNLFDKPVRQNPPAGEHIRLSYRDNFISFEFAALDYTTPEKNQYAYMLEGLDEGWVQAGTRRYANYPDLGPGDYVFRVKGSNNDGVWNEAGTWVRVTVAPPFWETVAFRAATVVALVLGAVGVYRLRVRSLEAQSRELEHQVRERTAELVETNVLLKQEITERQRAEQALAQKAAEEAVAAERGRLARELHDAVTQTLFSASLIAEALPKLWDMDQEEGRQLLVKLRQLSRGALSEMRALLFELRPAALAEADLYDLLRQLADATTGRTGIVVTVTTEGAGELPTDVRIALYRIAQEALNNVGKHARADRVGVRLGITPPHVPRDGGAAAGVTLEIEDDGLGFDRATIPADRLGVSIMHERAEAIGAALAIDSKPGRGTTVRIEWSASRAAEGASDE